MRATKTSSIVIPDIKGVDDQGRFYSSLSELHHVQELSKEEWYSANLLWWESGYGGTTDDEAMIGDCDGETDALIGLAFLDKVILKRPQLRIRTALDCAAGVGRITKFVLSRRCSGLITLLEANRHWSERSRTYLGRKRSAKCRFVNGTMQDLDGTVSPQSMDLIWFQWCLQYLTDEDAILALTGARHALTPGGVIIVRENKPTVATTGSSRLDRFQMDTPSGTEGRYDITRPRAHHEYLFRSAGLHVIYWEEEERGEVMCAALETEGGMGVVKYR
eukprot:CAMPEP_0182422014 /NCGR_PEP_ID=MMETSP1167-20130531/7604_1 /TAXON_ID=2988 /ORGANISM="Mallomonas Sp, Strain CCMP3275" /LENGTH=275 /DNA_ID=CAMNT_0024599715 /DNA_START=174 /DNA_END=1001 /DNA_ORIENTATION=+